MLKIRFSRVGRRNKAYFKVVLTESSFPVKGRFLEQLGSYDPHLKKAILKKERITYWLQKGVQASDSVFNLLVREKVIDAPKKKIKIKSKKTSQQATEGIKNEEVKKEEVELNLNN